MPFIDTFGWGCSIFFVTMIIFGNLMLLNLFLAILLNYISDNLEEEDAPPAAIEEHASDDDIIEEELDYI